MSDSEKKEPILSVKDLQISFKTDEGLVHAVRGVSFDLYPEETLCIVGESGSGKSVTSKTIMGILPANAIIEGGQVLYEGEDLTKVSESEFHRIRGHQIGMIFQDPLSSLNPIMKVGKQITEAMLIEKDQVKRKFDTLISKEEAAYRNCKVAYRSKVDAAKNAVVHSDSHFDDEISTLERKRSDADFEFSKVSPKDPSYPAKKAQFLKDDEALKKQIAALKQEKKKAHRELKKKIPQVRKEARSVYRHDLPLAKKALAEKTVEAKKEIQDWKKSVEEAHQEKLSAIAKEEKTELGRIDAEIERLNQAPRPSESVYRQKLSDLQKARAEKAKAFQKRKDEENLSYQLQFRLTKKRAKAYALKIMAEVGIPQPEIRFNQYPFEFSGGMRQRIVIAIALVSNPHVLICDEPTTALDVTIQAQILELINRLKKERHMSVIFISHDLGVVANMADRVAVMYAGRIVEVGTANEIFYDPRHPYTWALLSSIPDLDSHEKLEAIPGTPPYLLNPPKGDAFAARNKYALAIDFKEQPPYFKISDTHYAATWLLDARAPKVEMPRIVSQRIKASLKKAGIHDVSELEGRE